MKNAIFTLFLLHLFLFGFSQDLSYDVRGTYQRAIVKEKLNEAKTMIDINPGYPSSWISGYISVGVLATCNGIVMQALGANDTLSNEQMNILKKADIGTDIVIDIKYYKENSLDEGDIQTINFSFTVIPETEATYPGGHQLLRQYLKENAIDKISQSAATQFQLATVLFSIDENGEVIDSRISMSSGNEEIDDLLIQAIKKMQKWEPAKDSNGINVRQEFEFSVGTMIGC